MLASGMKKFYFTLLYCYIFFNGVCQNATQLSITKLQFNNSQEEQIFNAIEKKQPFSDVALFLVIDSAISDKEISESEQEVNDFMGRLTSAKPGQNAE